MFDDRIEFSNIGELMKDITPDNKIQSIFQEPNYYQHSITSSFRIAVW